MQNDKLGGRRTVHILRQPIVLGACLICFGFAQPSHAHDQQHPEWIEWLMSQKNQYNGECCTGQDVTVLEDKEWAMKKDHYEVLVGRNWVPVPSWAITMRHDNITGSALLWVWQGHVQCFKPGFAY
jgi:hypothetical protein